jgi:hypothetical protein
MLVRLDADRLELEPVRVGAPPDRVEERLGAQPPAADEPRVDRAVGRALDELEHGRALVDERHAHAERREHGRVLEPDHARADDHEVLVERAPRAEIGVEDAIAVDGHLGRARRPRARGHEHVLGREHGRLARAPHLDRVLVLEARRALDQLHAVALELVLHDAELALHDRADPELEVLERHVLLERVVLAVERALPQARQVEHRLAQRLARDRARVERGAAQHAAATKHEPSGGHSGPWAPFQFRPHRAFLEGRAPKIANRRPIL